MQNKSAETDLWRGMCRCVCMIVNCLYKKLLAMRKYGVINEKISRYDSNSNIINSNLSIIRRTVVQLQSARPKLAYRISSVSIICRTYVFSRAGLYSTHTLCTNCVSVYPL
jgi:hypothetical protein